MKVEGIEIWRDGGTIVFQITESSLAGRYRLQTPFAGRPEPLYRDGAQLGLGSAEETALADDLQRWLDPQLGSPELAALSKLDAMQEWRNLPAELLRVVPLHRIRRVIRCLRDRAEAK